MRRPLHIFAVFSWYILDAQSTRWLRNAEISSGRRRGWRLSFIQKHDNIFTRGGSSNGGGNRIEEECEFESPEPLESSSLSLLGKVTTRHCSDLLLDLRRRSTTGGDRDESLDLRKLISKRCAEYLAELREASARNGDDDSNRKKKLPHPRKLLHFLASKVPAIKHSPDVNLRIHSALADIDSGVAACVVTSIAHICEVYDKERLLEARRMNETIKQQSAAQDLISDRRFEQLIECVLSGVNVKRRNREALRYNMHVDGEDAEDIEDILDEDLQESDGLSVRDACRAAWGIAILVAHHLESLGGEKILDLLQALSLRTRELLLARLKLLRQADVLSEPELAHFSTEDRMNELASELAQDAACAMWTFSCVRACTGLRSVPLFEICCSILCQDPMEMRRRAQEDNEESERMSVGNNDVVDRLARADTMDAKNNVQPNVSEAVGAVTSNKDTLLDWLSKTQMNDIMWALALHGRENKTDSTVEVTLSETAATLGEIAFDRIIEALEDDLKAAKKENEGDHPSILPKNEIVEQEEPSMMVEVVDAAALLACEAAQQSSPIAAEAIGRLPVERMTLKSTHVADGAIQQVQVVDATALVAATGGDNSISVETEIVVPSPPSLTQVTIDYDEGFTSLSNSPGEKVDNSGKERIFSTHDLAGMAWSVTELHDPLRMQVVPSVVKLVAMLGESGTEDLSGAELANLAWAVSRYEAEASKNEAHNPSSLSLSVISWISHTSLARVRKKNESERDSESLLLEQFQPPELGRLLWAVACVMSTYAQVPDRVRQDVNIHELAKVALKTASLHLSLFATEDLLRICWAFLELCGNDEVPFDPTISTSLGRILSTVEQSLYRWERGDRTSFSNGVSATASVTNEGSLFSSFFGKPRLNQPLLEQTVGDHDDDDDNRLAPILRKSRRPFLRDLSVDPSTLCKAACAFQRIMVKHPEIKGGWKLTNVAIRLLTSKNARLMKECSVHDIVRLCEAAVRSDRVGHGRELITGLFAHKVVQVLNEVFDELENGKKQTTSISIGAASPAEMATLVWALGYLGVKHALPDESRQTAYKRLRLVTDTPPLKVEQVMTLDLSSASKLVGTEPSTCSYRLDSSDPSTCPMKLRGMVLLKYFQSDSKFLLQVLQVVYTKASGSRQSADELCSLAETLAILKEALKNGDSGSDEVKQLQGTHERPEEVRTRAEETVEKEKVTPSAEPEIRSIEDELVSICDHLLASIAENAREAVHVFSAQELQRLLSVYSLLPCQADDLIDDIEAVVQERLSTADDAHPKILVEKLLQDAMGKIESVQKQLFHERESSEKTTLSGILSLFRPLEEDDLSAGSVPKELLGMIRDAINSNIAAFAALQEMQENLKDSIDSISQQNREGASFELGRCQELIANYRRIEFRTGTRRSRYDKDRRKDMSKRFLRRLLPQSQDL